MFIPGKAIQQFKTEKGKEVVIRYPKWEDLEPLLGFINNLSAEDTFILRGGEQVTKNEEMEYLAQSFKDCEKGKRIHLVATLEGKMVVNAAVIKEAFRRKHVGRVAISVSEGYREEGIGTQVLKTLISESKKLGLKMLALTVFANNERAKHVYQKVGFTPCGTFPKMFLFKGEYVDQITMYLEL